MTTTTTTTTPTLSSTSSSAAATAVIDPRGRLSEFSEDLPTAKQFRFATKFQPVKLATPDASRVDELFDGLQTKLDTLKDGSIYEKDAFTQNALEDVIRSNIGSDGAITSSPEKFGEELTNLLATGLAEVRLSNNPVDNQFRFLNTVAQALEGLSDTGDVLERDAAPTVEAVDFAVSILLGQPLRVEPDTEEKDDFDISTHVDELFGVDLHTLANRALSLDEIRQIRFDFDRELLGKFRSPDQITDLRDWVEVYVETPSLKAALLSDINNRLRERTTLQDTTVRGVPQLIPLSSTKSIIVQKPLLHGIAAELEHLNFGLRISSKTTGAKSEVRNFAKTVATELNAIFLKHGIREGVGPGAPILTLKKNLSAAEFVSEFDKIIARLGSSTATFTYAPNPSMGEKQNSQQILKEIMMALEAKPRTADMPMMPHADMVMRLGLIRIHSMPGKPEKEITIPPETIMANIMRLAVLLLMEDGELEDKSGREVLSITSKTKPGEIVSYIQQMLRLEAGKMIRLLYIPKSAVGGSFLSALGSIVLAPVKAAVGVVGAAAGAVGSLLGGQLPQPIVVRPAVQPRIGLPGAIQKPLFLGGAIQADPRKLAFLRMTLNSFTRKKKGGAVKLSQISGAIGAAAGVVSILSPPLAIVAAPIAAVASVVSAIGGLFGF